MQNKFFSKAEIYPLICTNKEDSTTEDLQAAKRLSLCSSYDARKLIPFETAKKLNVLPLSIIQIGYEKRFSVATAPYINDNERLKILKFCTNLRIQQINVKNNILNEALNLAYLGDDNRLVEKTSLAQEATSLDNETRIEELEAIGEVSTFLSGIIDYAVTHQASDIHFIPIHDGAILRLRINGDIRENRTAINSLHFHQEVISRLKVLAKLPISKVICPLDGSFKQKIADKLISIRVNIMPTIHGEKAVLRLLGVNQLFSLEKLGFNQTCCKILKENIFRKEGAILFSGPTGSGKSSSLYALLNLLRDKSKNIISIEDPVEMELVGISQTNISEQLTYKDCLKAVLRQDPDVIMVGEIREAEVAKLALNAALTGHLLLSTIHVRSVLDIPMRLFHLGIDQALIAQTLSVLISQRLLPKLCDKCKVIDLNQKYDFPCFKAVGCQVCDHSGYLGRVLTAEVLIIDDNLRAMITTNHITAIDLKHYLTKENFIVQDNLELLKSGLISADIV